MDSEPDATFDTRAVQKVTDEPEFLIPEAQKLPDGWYEFVVPPDVQLDRPGIYEWAIDGLGRYIGKYKWINRPRLEYGRNVNRLLAGKPYRKSKPGGFRLIHTALFNAWRDGRQIRLTILENVDPANIDAREQELIRERGELNSPPFGLRPGTSNK